MALALDTDTPENQTIFIDKKVAIDYELALLEENFNGLVCGVTDSTKFGNNVSIISPHEIKNFLYNKATTPLVIDVSEQQEFCLRSDWGSLGIEETPLNIPLTRFTNFIRELLALKKFHHDILFICRSGERSLQAVTALRRFGFSSAWSLDGGLALASLSNGQWFKSHEIIKIN